MPPGVKDRSSAEQLCLLNVKDLQRKAALRAPPEEQQQQGYAVDVVCKKFPDGSHRMLGRPRARRLAPRHRRRGPVARPASDLAVGRRSARFVAHARELQEESAHHGAHEPSGRLGGLAARLQPTHGVRLTSALAGRHRRRWLARTRRRCAPPTSTSSSTSRARPA